MSPEVAAALRALGLEAVEAEPIHSLPLGADRETLRIRLAGGGSVKVRRFPCARLADRYLAIARAIEAPLVRVLGGVGALTVEEWIEGVPLSTLPLTTPRLEQAADLLGRVHTARPPARRMTGRIRRRTRKWLTRLAGAGALAWPTAGALLARVDTMAPRRAALAVVHGDMCAENLLEIAGGRLVAIDNERLQLAFLDFDLARTWVRWPLTDEAWQRFEERYARWRRPAPRDFWRIAALALSANVRLTLGRRPEGLYRRLDALAAAG